MTATVQVKDPRQTGRQPHGSRGVAGPHAAGANLPKVPCADCQHCHRFPEYDSVGRYILKVRCAKGNWRRGKRERTCEFHTVLRRIRVSCIDYESTSESNEDRKEYLRMLRDTLPLERHIYHPDGSFVDKTEMMLWEIETI